MRNQSEKTARNEKMHSLLLRAIEEIGCELEDQTDFSKGSRVWALSAKYKFSTVVTVNRALAGNFRETTLDREQRTQVEEIIERHNSSLRGRDPLEEMLPEERENWESSGYRDVAGIDWN